MYGNGFYGRPMIFIFNFILFYCWHKKNSCIFWLANLTHAFHAGRAHSIVLAERVVLNFMQRMSGIATLTKVCELHDIGEK